MFITAARPLYYHDEKFLALRRASRNSSVVVTGAWQVKPWRTTAAGPRTPAAGRPAVGPLGHPSQTEGERREVPTGPRVPLGDQRQHLERVARRLSTFQRRSGVE